MSFSLVVNNGFSRLCSCIDRLLFQMLSQIRSVPALLLVNFLVTTLYLSTVPLHNRLRVNMQPLQVWDFQLANLKLGLTYRRPIPDLDPT